MPTPALALALATLLPLASFVLLVFVGKRMGKLAGFVGTAAIFASFVCSMIAMASWVQGGTYRQGDEGKSLDFGFGKLPISLPMKWVPVGEGVGQAHKGFIDVGLYVDSLTIVMFAMVTLVATLVHVFSIGYMAEDKRFPRFFTYLSLFCFSMLGLVLGGTILQLFIFWELVGLCSYLLIGFWYEKKSASNAAIKAFVVNRVGDFGFLIGFGILFYHLGNVTLPDVWSMLDSSKATGAGIHLASGVWFTPTLLTITGIGLFFGAVGKSAQFPLHVWLPDAMEGPTPVSALIHAATMVAAGVYLVGRIFPILTADARLFIAIIGCTTLTMAALIALAQTDIKKVLAYSTLSQLGYMILAMGVGSWVGGLFHLITHAFFKALLFLGSGSVIHAAHHEQEMTQYGGLFKKIPVTAITFLIAVFAIAGTPFLSGYYSKDIIIANAGAFAKLSESTGKGYWALFILPTVIAYVTPFYMMRCWMLTFWGKPRNKQLHDHAHESPILWFPLVVLSIFAVISGYKGTTYVRELIENARGESVRYVTEVVGDAHFGGFNQAWPSKVEIKPGEEPTHSQEAFERGEHLVHSCVFWAFAVGMGLAFVVYINGFAVVNVFMKIPPVRWINTWLYRRMYFDELYMGVIVAILMGLSALCSAFDKYVIDGIVNLAATVVRGVSTLAGLHDKYVVDGAVNGVASASQSLGEAVRSPQTGRIRVYVTFLLGLVALGIVTTIIVLNTK